MNRLNFTSSANSVMDVIKVHKLFLVLDVKYGNWKRFSKCCCKKGSSCVKIPEICRCYDNMNRLSIVEHIFKIMKNLSLFIPYFTF